MIVTPPDDPVTWGDGYLGLAQINPAPGDFEGNALKLLACIQQAERWQLDLIVFPELCLTGYPIRDIITRHPHLVDENLKWLQALAQHTGKTRAIVGFAEPRYTPVGEKATGKPFFNSLAILGEGGIEGLVRKSLLPTYSEFYDGRVFEPSPVAGCQGPHTLACASWGLEDMSPEELAVVNGRPIRIHGRRYGFSICEDTWGDFDFFNRPLYHHDPMAALARHQPDVLINISASPTRYRKTAMKQYMLSYTAHKYGIPLVYVNQVGAVDESIFDGHSSLFDRSGVLTARLAGFQPQLAVVHPEKPGILKPGRGLVSFALNGAGATGETTAAHESKPAPGKKFQPDDQSDMPRLFHALTMGIRDYFKKCGFQHAVLGLSGGLDSAVTVTLLAAALGPSHVLAVSLPSVITSRSSQDDARRLADQLGVVWLECPIQSVVNDHMDLLTEMTRQLAVKHASDQPIWQADCDVIARENAQAMNRATLLRLLGNVYRALPIATSDKSELYLGYATVNGDMSGALAPLGDVVKTRVRALAYWMNEHPELTGLAANVIPTRIIDRPPSAELTLDPATGEPVTAEAALMPYVFADEVIWRIEALQQNPQEMMQASFYIERQQRIDKQDKQLWLDRFYQRMAAATFKWWVAPPVLIVDSNGSIAKSDYQHPITAGKIQWRVRTMDEITACLNSHVSVCSTVSG